MKIRSRSLLKLGGLAASTFVRGWMSTLDYRALYEDESCDPAKPSVSGMKVYALWHEYLVFPLNLRGNTHTSILLSQHRDADILERVALHFGYGWVRGSTTRGGVKALREMATHGRQRNLVITPDGPRGPRRRMAPGPIYLASRLEIPLVLMGFGYDRPWRLNSWDRFAVPRPFSRARAVMSSAIHIPRDADRGELEEHRQQCEARLNAITAQAESWARSGETLPNEQPARREPDQWRLYHRPMRRDMAFEQENIQDEPLVPWQDLVPAKPSASSRAA